VLFLYSLLQWNSGFKAYTLARSDPESLIYPMLRLLDRCESIYEDDASHVYLLSILMLIFSQDASLCGHAHRRVRLADVPWFEASRLQNVSLGSLMFVVLLRVLQTNMSKMQDAHVHTYCSAALSNMSPHCEGLHPYACQRLVGMIRVLSRKLFFVQGLLAVKSRAADGVKAGGGPEGALASADGDPRSGEELADVRDTCAELLRAMLEMCCAMLSASKLRSNLDLVYALLHEKDVVSRLAGPPESSAFAALASPLVNFVNYLSAELDRRLSPSFSDERTDGRGTATAADQGSSESSASSDRREWTTEAVMKELKDVVQVWRGPELPGGAAPEDATFQYEETGDPDAFFLPYVWRAVVRELHDVSWDPHRILLFHATAEQLGVAGAEVDALSPEAADGANG
jgi:hypothetical protein